MAASRRIIYGEAHEQRGGARRFRKSPPPKKSLLVVCCPNSSISEMRMLFISVSDTSANFRPALAADHVPCAPFINLTPDQKLPSPPAESAGSRRVLPLIIRELSEGAGHLENTGPLRSLLRSSWTELEKSLRLRRIAASPARHPAKTRTKRPKSGEATMTTQTVVLQSRLPCRGAASPRCDALTLFQPVPESATFLAPQCSPRAARE
eukprot:scaffold1733_cov257-Pinguiococcus_pyrenoidosus.AAC.2